MNSEGITSAYTLTAKPIGFLNNKWRQRQVTVYDHPTDPAKVVSVGIPYGAERKRSGWVVCVEPRADYERVISSYPKVVVYN